MQIDRRFSWLQNWIDRSSIQNEVYFLIFHLHRPSPRKKNTNYFLYFLILFLKSADFHNSKFYALQMIHIAEKKAGMLYDDFFSSSHGKLVKENQLQKKKIKQCQFNCIFKLKYDVCVISLLLVYFEQYSYRLKWFIANSTYNYH